MAFSIEVKVLEPDQVIAGTVLYRPSPWIDVVSSSQHLEHLIGTRMHDGKKLHSIRLECGDRFTFEDMKWHRMTQRPMGRP